MNIEEKRRTARERRRKAYWENPEKFKQELKIVFLCKICHGKVDKLKVGGVITR